MHVYTMLYQVKNTQQMMGLDFINVTEQLEAQVQKVLSKHLNSVFVVFNVLN